MNALTESKLQAQASALAVVNAKREALQALVQQRADESETAHALRELGKAISAAYNEQCTSEQVLKSHGNEVTS